MNIPSTACRSCTLLQEKSRDYWHVTSTGNYEHDWLLGEAFGHKIVAYIREHDAGGQIRHGTLGSVVRDIVRKGMGDGRLSDGDGGGLILGFMRVISQAIAGRGPGAV